jgi:hypothetical protein
MDQKYLSEIKPREPVVRCRDCKYHGACDTGWPCDITDDNDFCSYGERKNGDVGAIQTSQLDIKPLIAEVERLTAENTTLKKAYELAEVKHAHWIEVDDDCSNIWECSHCGLVWEMSNDSAPGENEMFYCPRCGSLMDEKDDSHG